MIQHHTIPDTLTGKRLDQALSILCPDYSRSRLQKWIGQGSVTVDGEIRRSRDKVYAGEEIKLEIEIAPEPEVEAFAPEPIALQIMHQDDALVVVNKPAGLVVHPATGNWSGTLMNGLLHAYPELKALPRAGIVHRLDKETSGLMVVARSLSSHKYLVDAMQARLIKREYQALVQGNMVAGGTVDAAMGRHPVDRKRMAVTTNGKTAVTHYRVSRRFKHHTLLDVMLETGRTHQIRVHMAHIRHPIVGDQVYGGRLKMPAGASDALIESLSGFKRQALHACRLSLRHPVTGESLQWQASLPQDFQDLLAVLESSAASSL